jgi:hypothetical protein
MTSIQTELASTVDLIADDVAAWPSSKRAGEYTVNKVPIHLVLPPLTAKIGETYVVVGTESSVVVKRRPEPVKHA